MAQDQNFVAVRQDEGPLHRTRDEQLATLSPEKLKNAQTLLAQAAE